MTLYKLIFGGNLERVKPMQKILSVSLIMFGVCLPAFGDKTDCESTGGEWVESEAHGEYTCSCDGKYAKNETDKPYALLSGDSNSAKISAKAVGGRYGGHIVLYEKCECKDKNFKLENDGLCWPDIKNTCFLHNQYYCPNNPKYTGSGAPYSYAKTSDNYYKFNDKKFYFLSNSYCSVFWPEYEQLRVCNKDGTMFSDTNVTCPGFTFDQLLRVTNATGTWDKTDFGWDSDGFGCVKIITDYDFKICLTDSDCTGIDVNKSPYLHSNAYKCKEQSPGISVCSVSGCENGWRVAVDKNEKPRGFCEKDPSSNNYTGQSEQIQVVVEGKNITVDKCGGVWHEQAEQLKTLSNSKDISFVLYDDAYYILYTYNDKENLTYFCYYNYKEWVTLNDSCEKSGGILFNPGSGICDCPTDFENDGYYKCKKKDIKTNEAKKSDSNSGKQQQKSKEEEIKKLTEKINKTYTELQGLTKNLSEWKNTEGKFNTARLASDSTAAVVLGTVGGVVTAKLVKKSQVKKGFESLQCYIGGQPIAAYGDEVTIGR